MQSVETPIAMPFVRHSPPALPMKEYFSPLRLLMVTMALLFIAEMLDVCLKLFLPPLILPLEMLLDALLLTALAFPALYLLLFRPLTKQIAERKRMEEALKMTQVRTERLAATEEVIAAVAHGIRNPLGNIRLVTQEILEVLEPLHDLREPLSEIVAQVDLLEARLRSFLSTTRPFDLSRSPTAASVLVESAIQGIRQRLIKRDIMISVDVDAAQTILDCDAVKIEEALQELLVNSVEADADTIRIVEEQVRDIGQRPWTRLTIEDDGMGLTSEALGKALYPFFTTKPLGTGLGLVVAKKIIEEHGGVLLLDACDRGGTRATVWLPSGCRSKEELQNGGHDSHCRR